MAMRINDEMPGIEGATEWINGTESDASELTKGSPTLVHFWATSCGICKDNMSDLQKLQNEYGRHGLKTLAVHMPRYEADTDISGVREAINKHSIHELCAVDNGHKLKDAFKNDQGWVPVYYLFDADGKLRSRSAGEFGIGVLTKALEKMFDAEAVAATN